MKRAVAVVVLLGSVVLSAQSPRRDVAPAKVGSGVIRGRVLSIADGSPIRKARVSVSAGASEHDPVYSDGDGRFELRALPAGRYSVTAAKAGFATTTFGARRFLDRPVMVVVSDGSIVDRIDVLMPKSAAIMGRVLDDLGDPVVGLNVTAGRVVSTDGRLRLMTALSVQTDDLGEYRLGGLAAGSYIVSVSSGPNGSDGTFLFGGGMPPGATVWTRTYHPSTTSLAQAEPITLDAGQEIPAVDFAMRPTPAPRLWITASDATGHGASGNFMIVSASPFDTFNRSGSLEDGFASVGLEPGDWTLFVRGPQGLATATFTADADDVVVDVMVRAPAQLSGRIIFEGATRPPTGDVVIEGVIGDRVMVGMMNAVSKTNRDGTFTIGNLIGARELRLRSAPPGWQLKSLTLGERSLLDGPVEFRAGEELTGAVAVMSTRHPALTGTVVAENNAPIKDYSLLVFPEDRTRLGRPDRWLRWTRPDQHGRFAIDDLPAGDYLAIAVSDVDGANWSNAAYLDRLRPQATRVTIGEGEPTTIELPFMGPQ